MYQPKLLNILLTLAATALQSAQGAILYQDGTIISFDTPTESLNILHNASLLIENDRITAITQGGPPANLPSNTTVIDATDKIIGPGYVDTHHHMWQTAFKTIGADSSLAVYFQRYGEESPAEDYYTADDMYVSSLAGYLEILHHGTTTVFDFAHGSWSNETIDAAANAAFDSGARSIYAPAVHIIPNGFPWETQIQKLESLVDDPRFAQNNPASLVSLGLGYDAFYNAPMANITELWTIVKQGNISVVGTHDLDGPLSNGNSPSLLHSMGLLNDSVPIIFGHFSFPNYEDAELLRATNQYISSTVESEDHFGQTHAYAHLIQDQASLGVDCHFSFSSSMVGQARLWLQSLRSANYDETQVNKWIVPTNNPMSVKQAYMLITRSGGLALKRPDIGIIEVGAKADVVVYRTDSPNMIGWSDPVAAIILHSDTGDLEDVLVDGKFVKRNGQLLYPGYDDIRQRLTASAQRIQEIWAMKEWDELTGNLGGDGGPLGMADVIDTQRGNGTGY